MGNDFTSNNNVTAIIESYKNAFVARTNAAKLLAWPLVSQRHSLEDRISLHQNEMSKSRFWQWSYFKASAKRLIDLTRHGFLQKKIDTKFNSVREIFSSVAAKLTEEAGEHDHNGNAHLLTIKTRSNPYSNLYPAYKDLLLHINYAKNSIRSALSNVQTAQAAKMGEMFSTPSRDAKGNLMPASAFHTGSRLMGAATQFEIGDNVSDVQHKVHIVHNKAYRLQAANLPAGANLSSDGLGFSFVATQILDQGILNTFANFVNLGILGDLETGLKQLDYQMSHLHAEASVPVNAYHNFESQRKQDEMKVLAERRKTLLSHTKDTPSLNQIFASAAEHYFGTQYSDSAQKLDRAMKRAAIGFTGAALLAGGAYVYNPVRDYFTSHARQSIPANAPSVVPEPISNFSKQEPAKYVAPIPRATPNEELPISNENDALQTEDDLANNEESPGNSTEDEEITNAPTPSQEMDSEPQPTDPNPVSNISDNPFTSSGIRVIAPENPQP